MRGESLTVCGAQPVVDALAVRRDSYCWQAWGLSHRSDKCFLLLGLEAELFVCAHVCVCAYVHMCACVYVHVCARVFMCARVCMCMCTFVCMCASVHAYMYTRLERGMVLPSEPSKTFDLEALGLAV